MKIIPLILICLFIIILIVCIYFLLKTKKDQYIVDSNMIVTTSNNGRLGNQLFRNVAASMIAKKQKVPVKYSNDFSKLGLKLYNQKDLKETSKEIVLTEDDFINYIKNSKTEYQTVRFNLNKIWCQTPEFATMLYNYLRENKKNIINANPYKNRHQNNEDVFIHVRLGDTIGYNPGMKYYEKVLDSIKYNQGYISSDSINHNTCKKLIDKYNLEIINKDEIETWQFASTCRNIILSNGTFSWTVAALAFYSQIYYPQIKKKWHGDIFNMPNWIEITV